MTRMMLTPWYGNLVAEGRVSYSATSGTWNTIRIQKDISKEFPLLKEKRAKIGYRIEHVRTIDNLKKKIKEIEEQKTGIPLLLYLFLEEPLKK